MFSKILIANRGEIACRVIRTASQMGVRTVAVYSDADADALHVQMADEAVRLGPPPVNESYLRGDLIVAAALQTGAEAIHPGYGFLSENPDFVEAVEKAGLVFIGPSADAIRAMGLKDAAKKLMVKAGVPVVPGYHGENQDPMFLAERAVEIGYPVLIKARAGGGGKGMRKVERSQDFASALEGAQREGQASFGDGHVLIEKYVQSPRHIEVQVFGDKHGNAVHLYERDCSLQRRHQKVIEEAPAPGMTEEMRTAMTLAAVNAAKAINYSNAGTVEFIVDGSAGLQRDKFWFMEMNTRLQVEHPVTEMVTGVDLVEWQLQVASGEELPRKQEQLTLCGHAMEARIYAEDPANGFLPSVGKLQHIGFPKGDKTMRVDHGIYSNCEISPFYDPMIAKVIAKGEDREAAISKLGNMLQASRVEGLKSNGWFLQNLLQHPEFSSGDVDTGIIERDIDELTKTPKPPLVVLAMAVLLTLGTDGEAANGSAFSVDTDDSQNPWDSIRSFRIHGEATLYGQVSFGGEVISADFRCFSGNRFEVAIGDNIGSLKIINSAGRSHLVEFDNHDCLITEDLSVSDNLVLYFESGRYEFALLDPLVAGSEQLSSGDTIVSPMPGLIKQVSCAVGDKVSSGGALLVLEAMKMEHTLTALRDGIISAVNATPGDQVEDGVILIEFEEVDV